MIIENHSKELSLSILMANYNKANYIETAIKSVINQTYPNWELIIVDDCSIDDSKKIINKFVANERIKLICHKVNQGYSAALKTAVENAHNDILGILDSDDKLHIDALKIMAEAYHKFPKYGFIYSSMWICDAELKNCKIQKDIGFKIPEKTFIFNPYISHFKTFRREVYNKTTGYDLTLKAAVDKDIIYKLEEITEFKKIKKPLYYYRKHDKGISQGKKQFQASIYCYIAKCKTYRRRLKTDLPNFSLRNLYTEYFKITLNRILILLRFFKFIKYIYNHTPKMITKLIDYSLNLIKLD